MRPKFHFLLSEADANTFTGAGALAEATPAPSAEPPAAETPAEPQAAAPVEALEKPGFLQTVLASVQDKGKLAHDLHTVRAQLTTTEQQLALANTELQTLRVEKQNLIAERTQIQLALQTAQAAQQSVEIAAADVVASLGFTPATAAELPAAQEPQVSPIEALEKQYAAETDLQERHKIGMQIREAMRADQ
jgi:hypothetical protein